MKNIFPCLFLIATLFISCKDSSTATKAERINTDIIPAIEELDLLIAENPENHALYFDRANVYLQNDGYQEAINDLNKAIEIDSLKPEYHHLLADSYLDYYQSKKAIDALKRALTIFPNRTATELKLSEFYLILKQFEKSIQTAAGILSREPTNGEAYFMMGMNFRANADTVKSIYNFQAAIENDPELIDAWIILGTLYEAKKDPKAIEYYDGALEVEPNNISVLHAKAFFLQNNDNIPAAQALYRKIIKLDRNYMDAPLNSGILYLEQDSIQKAFEQFNILVENVPENPMGYFYRGICHEQSNRTEAAKEDFNNALRLDPNYDRAARALSRVQGE